MKYTLESEKIRGNVPAASLSVLLDRHLLALVSSTRVRMSLIGFHKSSPAQGRDVRLSGVALSPAHPGGSTRAALGP